MEKLDIKAHRSRAPEDRHRPRRRDPTGGRRRTRRGIPIAGIAVAVLVGAGVVSAGQISDRLASSEWPAKAPHQLNPGCKIKGNISNNGERIFHAPGQKYYAATRIDIQAGERWFCSEGEAIAAGWRKARI